MPYPDNYTAKGAPDSGASPRDLDPDHPFAGYSEREIGVVDNVLHYMETAFGLVLQYAKALPDTSKEYIEGTIEELRAYNSRLSDLLTEAFESLGD